MSRADNNWIELDFGVTQEDIDNIIKEVNDG